MFLILSSCDYLPRRSERTIETTINDTIYVVKEKLVEKTVIDTIYVTIERTSPKSEHQVFVDTLKSYLGTRELTGRNDGETVERVS